MRNSKAMICVATVLFFLQTLAAALALSSQKDGIDRKVGIRKREESSSSDETEVTMGYIWDYETTVDGTTETFWTPFTHTASPFSYTTTLDNYYFWRPYVISYSTSTASDRTDEFVPMTVSPDGPGPDTMWTACSNGTITGTYSWDSSGNTSSSCAYGGWDCFTYIIQSRFDDTTDRLTSLECRTSYSTDSSETIIYREEPAKIVLTTTISVVPTTTIHVVRTSTPPSNSASPGSSPTNIPSPTSSPNNLPSGNPRSNNAGVIAGSVVGGVAVLAIAGVAILWILKRNKRHSSTPYVVSHTPSNYYAPSSLAEKAPEQGGYDEQGISDVPEYVPPPTQMAYANSPRAQKTAKSVSQPLSPSSVHVDESQG